MLLFWQIYKKSWKNQGFFRLFTERDCARQRSCLRIPLPAGGVLAKLDGIRLICILLFFVRTSLRSSFASIEWFSLLKASFQCSNRSLSAASALPVHKKKWMQFFASTLRRVRDGHLYCVLYHIILVISTIIECYNRSYFISFYIILQENGWYIGWFTIFVGLEPQQIWRNYD